MWSFCCDLHLLSQICLRHNLSVFACTFCKWRCIPMQFGNFSDSDCCFIESGCSTKRRTICVVILDEQEYNLIQRKTEQRDPTKQASQQMQVLLHDLKKHYPNLWQANKQIKVSPCKYDGKEKRPMLGSVKFTPTCFNGLKRMVWRWIFIVNLLNQCVIVIGLFWSQQ